MKTYKKILTKVEDQVYCDVCGKSCTDEQRISEYATLSVEWGYGSPKDGQKFDIQMCENCFDITLDWLKNKRRRNLGPFTYPYEKDPLNGEQ